MSRWITPQCSFFCGVINHAGLRADHSEGRCMVSYMSNFIVLFLVLYSSVAFNRRIERGHVFESVTVKALVCFVFAAVVLKPFWILGTGHYYCILFLWWPQWCLLFCFGKL